MDELLQDKLRVVASDRTTVEALKTAFSEALEDNRPDVTKVDNNELIGQKYRAYEEAKKIINQVFMNIESSIQIKVDEERYNKGK